MATAAAERVSLLERDDALASLHGALTEAARAAADSCSWQARPASARLARPGFCAEPTGTPGAAGCVRRALHAAAARPVPRRRRTTRRRARGSRRAGGAAPHDVVDALARRARRADRRRARGRPLGRRGDPRRRSACSPAESTRAGARARDLPRRRARPRRTRCGSCSASSRRAPAVEPHRARAALAGGGRRARRAGRDVDAGELHRSTGGNPFFVTEVLAAGDDAIPGRSDAVLARVAALSRAARALLDAVAIVPQRVELWLLEALAPTSSTRSKSASLRGCFVASRRRRRVPARARAARGRGVDRAPPPASTCTGARRRARRPRPRARRTPPGSPTTPRRRATPSAVLRYAPAAAERAAALGAHREAAAQYARALRFADGLPTAERAALLERQLRLAATSPTSGEAIDALAAAIELHRACRRRAARGRRPGRLSPLLTCRGRIARGGRRRQRRLSTCSSRFHRAPSSHGRTSTMALRSRMIAEDDSTEAVAWVSRALELARARSATPSPSWTPRLARNGRAARATGRRPAARSSAASSSRSTPGSRSTSGVRGLHNLTLGCGAIRSYDLAERCARGRPRALRRARPRPLAPRTCSQIRAVVGSSRGSWADAAATARLLVDEPRDSPEPRIMACSCSALVRARRGDPGAQPLLDEARALVAPAASCSGSAAVACARAEIGVARAAPRRHRAATDAAFELALERRSTPWFARQLASGGGEHGIVDELPPGAAEPLALAARGRRGGRRSGVGGTRLPVRGGARARARRTTKAALREALRRARQLGAGALAAHGRAPPARARRRGVAARPAARHAREPAQPDRPRARGAAAARRGPSQRRDRRASLPLAAHGRPPRLRDPAQARRPQSRRGRRRRLPGSGSSKSAARSRNLGGSTDVAAGRRS